MSELDTLLQDAVNQIGKPPVLKDEPSVRDSALYKYASLVVSEALAWEQNPDWYSEKMKDYHNKVIENLGLQITHNDNQDITVMYTLRKENSDGFEA